MREKSKAVDFQNKDTTLNNAGYFTKYVIYNYEIKSIF